MKLKVTSIFTWYKNCSEEDIQIAMEENDCSREEVLKDWEEFEIQETIGRLEEKLDNQYVSDWNNTYSMEWIE